MHETVRWLPVLTNFLRPFPPGAVFKAAFPRLCEKIKEEKDPILSYPLSYPWSEVAAWMVGWPEWRRMGRTNPQHSWCLWQILCTADCATNWKQSDVCLHIDSTWGRWCWCYYPLCCCMGVSLGWGLQKNLKQSIGPRPSEHSRPLVTPGTGFLWADWDSGPE